jgi:hypothetical protein
VPEGASLVIDEDKISELAMFEPYAEEVGDDPLSRRQQRLLAAQVRQIEAAARAELRRGYDGCESQCDVLLATRHFASVSCLLTLHDERGGSDFALKTALLAIDAAGVREIPVESVFVPGTDLRALVRRACARATPPVPEDSGQTGCPSRSESLPLGLAAEGVTVSRVTRREEREELVLPYAEVADVLLASSPLARSLNLEGVTTREVTIDPRFMPDPGPAVPEVTRWAVMPPASRAELATAWTLLPAEQRASLRRADTFLVAPDAATARAAAASLGTTASEVRVPDAASPPFTLARTTREIPLLDDAGPDAEVLATLPRGTLVVVEGPLDEAVTRYPAVSVHAGLAGYADARRMEAGELCAPDLQPFLDTLPAGSRADARLQTLRAALLEGTTGRATYVTTIEGTTYVMLRRLGAGCVLDRQLAQFTLGGSLTRLELTRTAQRGGEPLVVSTTSEPSVVVHRLGAAEPVWSRALQEGERIDTSVREGEAWIPVSVIRPSGPALHVTFAETGAVVTEAVPAVTAE